MRILTVLVSRELEDHVLFYVLIFLIGCAFAGSAGVDYVRSHIVDTQLDVHDDIWVQVLVHLICLTLGAMALGTFQISGDRRAGISTFICTQTPTRDHLLIAKWLSGLLWILLGLLPVLAIHAYMLRAMELDGSMLWRVMVGLFLTPLAGHHAGLQIGFLENKALVPLVASLFVFLFTGLLVIKGFGFPCYWLLTLLIVALSVRTWWAFHQSAL